MIVGQEGSTVKLVFERGDHRSPVTCFLVRGDHREGLARPWGTSPTAPASGGVLLRRQNPPTNPPMHEVGGARVSHSGVHSVEPGSPTTGRTGRKSDAVFPSLDFFSGMAGAPASVDKSTVKRASPSDQGKNAPLRRSSEVVRRSIPSSPAARRPVPGSTEPQNGSACEKTTKPSAYLTHQELPYGHTFLERQAQRMWEARKAAGSDDGISEDEGQPRISRSRNSDGGSVAPTGKPRWVGFLLPSRICATLRIPPLDCLLTVLCSPRPLRMRPRGSGDSAHASSLLVHARSIWAAGKLSDEEETESDASS